MRKNSKEDIPELKKKMLDLLKELGINKLI